MSDSLSQALKETSEKAQRVRQSRIPAPDARSAKRRYLSACQTQFLCTLARATNPQPRAAKPHRHLGDGRLPQRTTLPRNPQRVTSRNHQRENASQLPGTREERPQAQQPLRSPSAKWPEFFRQRFVRVRCRALQRTILATTPRAIAKVEEYQKSQQAGFGSQPWKSFTRKLTCPS
jgi:hypothetical protein